MELFDTYGMMLIIFAAVVGFYMAWGIGANDVANAMGTSVGAKAITLKQAILIAAIFEFAGAYLAGGEVTSTIRKGIIDSTPFVSAPELLVIGMIASLMSAGTWLAVASARGWPVSTTHSIIGAIVGFAVVGVGVDAVSWSKVGGIVGSWVVTPAISGLIAYLIYLSAEKLIFETDHPVKNAKKYVPVYMALAGFVLALVTIKKGLKHIVKSGELSISSTEAYIYAIAVGVLVALIGSYFVRKVKVDPNADRELHFQKC